MLAFNLNLV